MQSAFKNTRKKLIVWLFEKSQGIYVRLFKKHKKAWQISKKELLAYPTNTLGYHYAQFLQENNFEILPKLERHDAYHVLTGYKSKVEDEIALQYLCFGNGKRSIYLFCVIILGTFILPDYNKYYWQSYHLGKQANPFYNLDFERLLPLDLKKIQAFIFTKETLNKQILEKKQRILE